MRSSCNFKYVLVCLMLGWSAMSVPAHAQTSWQEVFLDTQLQSLIKQGLERNTDLNVARLRIGQAEASLRAARMAFLPTLTFSPTAGISTFGGEKASQTYSLPLQASWQVDLFGKLKNAKQQQKMLVESSKAYEQAVQLQVIANIARVYYQCASLQSQLLLAQKSIGVWEETVRTTKAFMQEGQYSDAAVSQAEANREQVKALAVDLEQQIRESENTIRILVGDSMNTVQLTFAENANVARLTLAKNENGIGEIHLPITDGIPLQRLSARPDVQQAERNLAASIYATKEAKAAFYPSLTLSGTAGWTNSSGLIANPGKLLLEALASLTQPIFQNGKLKTDLAVKKSQQEEARLQFQQALLNAGIEVNNALTQVQTYSGKSSLLDNQVKALERTVKSTHLLQQNGSSNYLEVLTAQENLLSAQMARLQNQYSKVAAQIALWQAMPSSF